MASTKEKAVDKQNIFPRVRHLITETLDTDSSTITEKTEISSLGADSLDLVELTSALENEFDITIPDEVADGFKTVGDIVNFIRDSR